MSDQNKYSGRSCGKQSGETGGTKIGLCCVDLFVTLGLLLGAAEWVGQKRAEHAQKRK